MKHAQLSVREIRKEDVELIVKYWLKSDPNFLIGMGVDLSKLPSEEALSNMLLEQIETPIEKKPSYALIWEFEGTSVGHSNVNKIEPGNSAYMHLHLWNQMHRRKGMGAQLVHMSLTHFFENLKLNLIYCEPYALNPAPNRTLEKLGFEFEKEHITVPGSINFEQRVNRWKLTREKYYQLKEAFM